MNCTGHRWQEKSFEFSDNESVVFTLYYIGDQASAIVDIASTGEMTCKHGVLSSEAADTDTKLDADGLGIFKPASDGTDYHSIQTHFSQTDNWRVKMKGALPTDDPHTTTTGHWTEVTGGTVFGASVDGYDVKTDDSDSLYIVAGLTEQGPPSKVHNTDAGVEHELVRVIALSTYASGTSILKVYECDDVAGTETELKEMTTGATTVQVAYPAETTPATEVHARTEGNRLVVKLLNSAAMSVVRLRIDGRSKIVSPIVPSDRVNPEFYA